MRKKLILMTIALACATAQGAWAQQDGSPLRPVSAADVKVTAINNAYFTDEGIVVMSPDEDPGPALTRTRVSGMNEEGGASLTGAKLYSSHVGLSPCDTGGPGFLSRQGQCHARVRRICDCHRIS